MFFSKPSRLGVIDLLDVPSSLFQTHDLPIAKGYSVAPHHSGVFPVVPHLYRAWRDVWNISITTTEGYPRLFPQQGRRGFRYMGIQVSRLTRQ